MEIKIRETKEGYYNKYEIMVNSEIVTTVDKKSEAIDKVTKLIEAWF